MTPASKLLAKAIRNTANKQDKDGGLNCDVSELARVLARVIEGKTIDQAMGAPGDWGYGTPIGDALFALLKEPEPAAPPVVEWHYVADRLPEAEDAVLVATASSELAAEADFRGGAFCFPGSDVALGGDVYAWADLPAIPAQRSAAPAEAKGGA